MEGLWQLLIGVLDTVGNIFVSNQEQKATKDVNDQVINFENKKLAAEQDQANAAAKQSKDELKLKRDTLNFSKSESALDRIEKEKETTYNKQLDKVKIGFEMLNKNDELRTKWLDMWGKLSPARSNAALGGLV